MSTLLLARDDVRGLLKMPDVIWVVEEAFKEWAEGEANMPPKTYVGLERGDFRAMPAALPGAAGVKWVNVHPQNPSLGLPTVMAIIIYSDPDTGYPLAVMDATEITAYRTGATSAIASKYLARQDSQTLGLVGAGYQAHTQLLAHAEVFDLKQVRVYDLSSAAVDRFIKSFPNYPLKKCSLEETAASDIVCTQTTAQEPFLKADWVTAGTHINAVGADAKGKGELEPAILKRALVVVDELEQASAAGEINAPLRKGLFSIDEVHGTLGEVITGRKPGRGDKDMVTVFDSTGVAIADIAVAKVVCEKAKKVGGYLSFNLVEE